MPNIFLVYASKLSKILVVIYIFLRAILEASFPSIYRTTKLTNAARHTCQLRVRNIKSGGAFNIHNTAEHYDVCVGKGTDTEGIIGIVSLVAATVYLLYICKYIPPTNTYKVSYRQIIRCYKIHTIYIQSTPTSQPDEHNFISHLLNVSGIYRIISFFGKPNYYSFVIRIKRIYEIFC